MAQSYKLEYVYNKISENQRQEIVRLWVISGILNLKQANKRVKEVCVIVRNVDNEIVGVSTVYLSDIGVPNNPYFFMRVFIKEGFRGRFGINADIAKLIYKKLSKKYSNQAFGLVLELENKKLHKIGYTKYLHKSGWIYFSKNVIGNPLWYVRFDEPHGIFI